MCAREAGMGGWSGGGDGRADQGVEIGVRELKLHMGHVKSSMKTKYCRRFLRKGLFALHFSIVVHP